MTVASSGQRVNDGQTGVNQALTIDRQNLPSWSEVLRFEFHGWERLMDFLGLSVFGALRGKMQWHQARQGVLAENIANASTPGYVGRDVRAPSEADFRARAAQQKTPFGAFVTNAKHISASIQPANISSGPRNAPAFEITPDENGVVLEEQMMKVAENQMDYQMVTSLYTKNLGLIRTAIGRGS